MKRAFTLVEMLVAMALTLILITGIATFFAIVGDSVKDGRALIELGSQMRNAENRLNTDLSQITSSGKPWVDDGEATGYFEYFEGRGNDFDPNGDGTPDSAALITAGITNMLGDGDDFIAFTCRSLKQPFSGRLTNPVTSVMSMTQSQFAEIAWWTGFKDLDADGVWDFDEQRFIYRRCLVIKPDLTAIDANRTYTTFADAYAALRNLLQVNDISISVRHRVSGATVTYYIAPNTLSDLIRREYRFAHVPANMTITSNTLCDTTFPHAQQLISSVTAATATVPTSFVLQGEAAGEDVFLANALAFDVQLYDPYVRIWPSDSNPNNASTALHPHDPGYPSAATAATPANFLGLGGFVDLAYYRYLPTANQNENATLGTQRPYYCNAPAFPPAFTTQTQRDAYFALYGCTYDTWPLSYESDGIAQLTAFGILPARMDWQRNGVDDDNANGTDDVNERETNAPYQQPLRGLQVKLRLYEPSTRQVRQITVGTDFVLE